jgi:hypothetical protein
VSDDATRLIPVFVPPLRFLLLMWEQLKGSPLSKQGVIAVRNAAICVAMAPSRKLEMDAALGASVALTGISSLA